MSIWTVERYDYGRWIVVDEDGDIVETFGTKQRAEDWLAFQQEAAEMQALHGDEGE